MVHTGRSAVGKMYKLDGGLPGKYRNCQRAHGLMPLIGWYEVVLVKKSFASSVFRYLYYVILKILYKNIFITVTFTVHFNISKIELCALLAMTFL